LWAGIVPKVRRKSFKRYASEKKASGKENKAKSGPLPGRN